YGLRNTDDTDEAGTVEAELVPIGHQSVARSESYAKHRGYNENGIYAGIVTRVEKDYSRGDYIMANMVNYDGTTTRKELMVNNNQLFAIDEVKSGENEAVDIRIINGDNSELVAGDYIIWVNDSDGDCAFVINLTDKNTYKDHDWTTPDWLYDNDDAINSEWEYIVDSQGQTTVVEKVVSFYGVSDDDGDRKITVSYNTAKAYADQYGEGAENVLNIQPTEIDPATIKVDPAGVTYNAIINGRMYTLTQSAQNTKFGELYSTDDDYAVVTYTNGTPTLHYTDDTATLKTLEDVLETTTGDKISVAGFDAKGNPKSSADAVSEMTSIVVTITNSDGEKRTVTFTDTTLVDASGGSISGFYKLTLSDGVKAYKDNTKAEEYKSGAYLATNTSPYFTSAETGVHGYFKIDSTEYNDAADVDRDEDGYLYFTVSNWKITKDTTVSFVKKAPIDGKIVVAAGSQALKVIENDGSRESDADYFIFVDEWFDTMTPDKNGNPSDPDEVLNQNVKGADKYLDLTGTVEHSNVNRNYFQWVKNWDNGVFTYKAAGEFGGKDDVKTFEFFTIAPADKKVPVISGIGDRVAIKDAGFDSNKTLSISVPEDKSTLHVDEILLDGKGTVLRFTDDSNGTNGLGKEVNLAENTKNTLYVEVECEGGYDSVIYTFEVTRGVVVP
ncbi:MAG: hypothetical protein HFF79_00085, partial [Oscillospiraceae bacterium]|nr:hypothetical protein [Oscillospiraceae bacterium]